MKKMISLLTVLVLALALCACGETSPAETEAASDLAGYVGTYTFYGARIGAEYLESAFDYAGAPEEIGNRYVDFQEMAGTTVTLNADGAGYLYWGEDNQGDITRWSMDGDALQIEAGVSVMDGTIRDGLMTVEMEDGFSLLYIAPGADVSGIELISMEDYLALLEVQPSAAE